MNNFNQIILLLALLIISSCTFTKRITGKTFKTRTKKRTAELVFDSDSTCRYINTFNCPDINPQYKKIEILCSYIRKDSIIILKNKDCDSNDCEFDLFIDIPVYNSKYCDFLNKKSRERQFAIGPTYATPYEKYGLIPNIDIDTIYVLKNRLVLYKEQNQRSAGIIFK